MSYEGQNVKLQAGFLKVFMVPCFELGVPLCSYGMTGAPQKAWILISSVPYRLSYKTKAHTSSVCKLIQVLHISGMTSTIREYVLQRFYTIEYSVKCAAQINS
jgi:hypothetical protein